MKCPHCMRFCRSLVMETRTIGDALLRRRQCGGCGRNYVSQEIASADLRIPRKRSAERQAAENAAKRVGHSSGPRGDGMHLQGVWR